MKRKTSLLLLGTGMIGLYAYLRTRGRKVTRRPTGAKAIKAIIIGAGFAGLTAAKTLGREAPSNVDVLLIDRNNYHLFTPLLYQSAACGIDPWDIAYPVRRVASENGFRFETGEVRDINFTDRQVILDNRTEDYDYLVLALGSVTNFFGQKTSEENSLTLKTLEDSVEIRNRVVDAFEKAAIEENPETRRRMLCFTIVGGGATGVEFASALRDLVFEVLAPDYPSIDLNEVRIILVEATDKLLGHIGDPLASEALHALQKSGIEVKLKANVEEVQPGKIDFTDGTSIPTGLVVWTAGVQAAPTAAKLNAEKGKAGTIVVDEYLRISGHPEVFAIGDNAWFVDTKTKIPLPMLASVAWQEGEAAAKNIVRTTQGQPLKPFHYTHYTDMVSFGRNSGAAEFGRFSISGFAGWLLWRLVHISLLTGYRDKLGIALDWTFAYFYDRDTSRLAVHPEHPMETPLSRPGEEKVA